jgi:formate hydrogenlyase subunit 4
MLLYGISMIYGATGSVDLQVVADVIARQGTDNLVLVFGLVFLVVGLSFKLGAVPFPHVAAGCLSGRSDFGDAYTSARHPSWRRLP